MQQAKKDNVIRFPDRKAETVATSQPQVPASPEPSAPKKKSVKKQLVGGLAAIIAISFLANRYAPTRSLDMASTVGRGLASVNDRTLLPEERDVNWEKSLAKELSRRSSRDLASLTLGHRPNDEERLRFGVLKSQYAVIMENGKLSEIRAAGSEGSVYVGDGEKFLKQNQNLMPVPFSSAVSEERLATSEGIQQTYELRNEKSQPVGIASFGMDRYGRLLKFSVTASTSVE
ncbi:MAG: hypothetical protein AB7N80_12570 [Bdellovibrionales bacterium]